MDSDNIRLIIGLGNPGESYKQTRHNVGFRIVNAFASKHHFAFKQASSLSGELAQGVIDAKKVLVFKSNTFMNESGVAIRRCVDYYKVPAEHLVIITDDAALPVGTMRMRTRGSSGGHNGLNSIEMHLNTQHYPRFRIGIGSPAQGRMKDFVLENFSSQEQHLVEEMIARAVDALEIWISAGIAAAMQTANAQKKVDNSGDKKHDQGKETPL